jgi:hypothetical protein
MSSPHPQEECVRRLAAVTSQRGDVLWYLDPKTAQRPVPLLRGYTGKWSIQVADWEASRFRYNYPSRLEAELHAAPGGGTKLIGQVGPGGQAQVGAYTAVLIAVIVPLVGLGVFITGLVLLSRGYIASALPDLLIPVAGGAIFWYFGRPHWRTWWLARDDSSDRLVRKVAGLLDATTEVPGAAGSP